MVVARLSRIEKLCSDLNDVCSNLEQSAFVHVKTRHRIPCLVPRH